MPVSGQLEGVNLAYIGLDHAPFSRPPRGFEWDQGAHLRGEIVIAGNKFRIRTPSVPLGEDIRCLGQHSLDPPTPPRVPAP